MVIFLKKHFSSLSTLFFPLAGAVIMAGMLAVFFCFPRSVKETTADFASICERLFQEEVTSDTLTLHYTLAFPEQYGISSYPLRLPLEDHEDVLYRQCRLENTLTVLSRVDSGSLSREDSYTLKLLTRYLTGQMRSTADEYYASDCSPSSGVPSQYPVLMAEYAFRSAVDVTDYLALLGQTKAYFSSVLEKEARRTQEGFALPDSSLEQTITLCDTIITEEELEAGTHFLQLTFRDRILPLVEEGIVSAEDAVEYIRCNNNLLSQEVLPAYQLFKENLQSLKGSCTNEEGLCHYPGGQEYYAWLVQDSSGCDLTVPQMLQVLTQDYNDNLQLYLKLMESLQASEVTSENNSSSSPETSLGEASFPLTDPTQILSFLEESCAADFPSLTDLEPEPVSVQVKTVSKSMEDYSSPAFYLTPPLDAFRQNTIYINEKETPQGLELFTTLGHEGYPGHLYQTVYYQLYSRQEGISPLRNLLYYGGYVEGWGIYAEFYAYDYALSLFPEENRDDLQTEIQLIACDRKLQLALLSILDIKVHYYGASLEDAVTLLGSYGVSDRAVCEDVYRYLIEEPANYIKYYMGYLQILALKDKARSLMGSAYSDREFHEIFLSAGPSDFTSLNERLEELYSDSGDTLPEK